MELRLCLPPLEGRVGVEVAAEVPGEQKGLGVTQATPIRANHSRSWRANPTGSQAALSMGAITARAQVMRAMSGISSAKCRMP